MREALEQPAEKEPSGRRATDRSPHASRAFGVSPNRRTVGAARAPGNLLRLQRLAGNGAVSRLVVAGTVNGDRDVLDIPQAMLLERGPAEPATMAEDIAVQRLAPGGACRHRPAPPTPTAPEDDPRFAKMEAEVGQTAKQVAKHPKPTAEAKKAAAAAEPPAGEIECPGESGPRREAQRGEAGGVRQEGVRRRGEGGDRGKSTEEPRRGRQVRIVREGRLCQGGGRREGDRRQGNVSQGDRDHHR